VTARLTALVAAVLLAGCGGEEHGGTATLWVTRDEGARVLLTAKVDAGQSAMRALDRETDLETSYGGRYVQAVDGLEGSLARGADWFYFVNGYEGDRSAAEYRLHDGDVVWFDYRSWRRQLRVPVVVGAFPEPFRHGYDGERRQTVVRYAAPELRRGARAIALLLRAHSVAPASVPVPDGSNVFLLTGSGPIRLAPDAERLPARPGDPVTFTFAGDGESLARDVSQFRFRYRFP
jgi:Domain of unknown function (DUF4430)